MDTLFMNSNKSKTSDPCTLLLNVTDKIKLKRWYTIDGKIYKSHIRAINVKYQLQHGMTNLNYLMDFSISDIQDYFEYIFENHEEKTVNLSIRININKTENVEILQSSFSLKYDIISNF